MILEAFTHSEKKLIFIGNWKHSPYGLSLKTNIVVIPTSSYLMQFMT